MLSLSNVYVVVMVAVLFSLSIFVHELGHFLLARWCGLVVDTFSIGFGPALWKRERNGITYKIGWIPFGGYVSLPQLDPSGMATVQGKPKDGETAEAAEPRVLPPVAAWRKIVVSVAGAAGNLGLAVLLAWAVYTFGRPVSGAAGGGPLLGFVDTNSVAYAAGLRAGDEVLTVNGEKVPTWQQFAELVALADSVTLNVRSGGQTHEVAVTTAKDQIGSRTIPGVEVGTVCRVMGVLAGRSAAEAGVEAGDIIREFDGVRVGSNRHLVELVDERAGQTVPMIVDRGGKTLQLMVSPRWDAKEKRALIGITFDIMQFDEMVQHTPLEQLRYDATAIVRLLRALVTPKEAKRAAEGMGGPTMIVATLWVVVKISLLGALSFTRFLNVNLAILNLLPIPVLDGGHVIFSLWEGVTRRRPNPRVVNALVNAFAVLFIALFLFLTYRDIGRLVSIRRLLRDDVDTNAVPAQVSATNGTPDAATSGVETNRLPAPE